MLCCQSFGNNQKRFFIAAFFSCALLFVVQYKFNYFSLSQCSTNGRFIKRFVEEELVEKNDLRSDEIKNKNVIIKSVENEKCRPTEYVLFLKTHKTGSSTITNILNRYAVQHNKTVLLPKGSEYYSFDWPNKFRLSSAINTYKRPNFLANHARYSRKSMNVLFPREDTIYISVLRHPVSQWESTFQYMSFPYILDISYQEDAMDFFLNNPPSTENIMEISRKYPSLYLIRNPLFFDLGLDHSHYDNSSYIKRALKTLDNDFELFLIMEHFDESLTLLRRKLCWEIDDVVYFKMNERLSQNKRNVVTQDQEQKIKAWNNADVVLYNYFVERFWRQVNDEGPGFYDDVIELKKRREKYSKLCIEKEAVEEAYSSVFVKGYKIKANLTGKNQTFCRHMLTNEIHFMDYFRGQHAKWVDLLEGDTIKNFDESTEEADIFIKIPVINATDFIYGAQNRPEYSKTIKKKKDIVHKDRKKHKEKKQPNFIQENSDTNDVNIKVSKTTELMEELSNADTAGKSFPLKKNLEDLKFDGKTIVKTQPENETLPWL
ncbi:galactose-3-O-sulfotransferase 2 [Hydra vulgaris]|uniref:galactose-3-O-sulfotransferase 2 n=1 Tax=Hydra vulgaris TaxID=6087 RepID=UPI000192620E|nr:galactose-3-O-sulfotransferase 2 [Hydra vulgaris]